MSQYENFVHDFPVRCLEVLQFVEDAAIAKDREVTLLLMAVSAAFLTPLERLNPKHQSKQIKQYPKTVAIGVKNLLGQAFLDSEFGTETPNLWLGGSLKSVVGVPDSWPELTDSKPLTPSDTVGHVLGVMRNGFAHGSVYIEGSEIVNSVVFVSEKKEGEATGTFYIRITPADLRDFFIKWINFLQKLKVSE